MGNPLRPQSVEQMPSAAGLEPPNAAERATATARTHLLNVIFIAGAIVVLFWRVFLLGNTLIDVATLNNQLPWGSYAGDHSDYPYDRRDPTDMYVTRDYFVVQAYRDGELPLWNPYTMSGHPIYADGVTRIFSPALLFYTFLDVPLGYTLGRLLELCCGALFLYWFLVSIGVRAQAAMFGALVFAFSSHSILHLVGLGWWGGLMWMPLMFLFADRAISRASFACATLAGIVLAAQIYSGYMANEIYYIGAIVLYYLFFGLLRRTNPESGGLTRPLRQLSSRLGMMAVTMFVGLSLSGPAWIPVLEQLKYSNRLIVPTQISYIYLPPWYLATLVFPSILGAPYDAKFLTLFQAVNVSHDHTLYMGIATLVILGFCAFWGKHHRNQPVSALAHSGSNLNQQLSTAVPISDRQSVAPSFGYDRLAFFSMLACLAILIITTAPLYVHVTRFIPVLQTIRVIMRAGVLLVFSASVLAAFGCQLLLDAPTGTILDYFRFSKRLLYLLAVSVAAAVIGAYSIRAAGLQAAQGKGKLAFIKKGLGLLSTQLTPPGPDIIIPLTLIALMVLLLYFTGNGRLSRRGLYLAIVGLLLADLFWNSRKFEHEYDRSNVYPQTQMTNLLASLPPGRVLPTPADIAMNRHVEAMSSRSKIIAPPNTLLPYRLPTVTGKDQIFPKWYHDFATLIEPQPEMSHVVFDQSRSSFFDLINVQYVMTHALDPAPEGMNRIEVAERVALYQNPSALSRAFFAKRVEVVASQAEAMDKMREPGFNPALTIVLERPEGPQSDDTLREMDTSSVGTSAESGTATPTARLIEDKRNSVQIEAESETGGILFLSDTYYPGWHADIDGIPAKIFKADVAFRAVRVSPGSHVVRFVFRPGSLRFSVYGVGAGLLVALAGLVLGRKRNARRNNR